LNFLVDTNVISEMRPMRARQPNPDVVRWVRSVPASSLHLSAITIFELELGALQARRRDLPKAMALRTWIDQYVLLAFDGRILPVDTAVAKQCATLQATESRSERDAFIAATGIVHNMIVVTRNISDFAPTGVATLNPWDA
jgi:predicted nucleic acid-binding protein